MLGINSAKSVLLVNTAVRITSSGYYPLFLFLSEHFKIIEPQNMSIDVFA